MFSSGLFGFMFYVFSTIWTPKRNIEIMPVNVSGNQSVIGWERIEHDPEKPAHAPTLHLDRPRGNYLTNKFDEDPFPDPEPMELDEKLQEETERKEIEEMTQRVIDNDIEQRFV